MSGCFLEETCTLAIVMLNYFDPKELGLPPGAIFSPRDVSSFNDIGYSAFSVAKECLSKGVQRNRIDGMNETLGFRSALGWASQGESSVVLTMNDIVKTVYMNAIRSGQLRRCLSLGYRIGNRHKSTTGGIQRRDCSSLQFEG